MLENDPEIDVVRRFYDLVGFNVLVTYIQIVRTHLSVCDVTFTVVKASRNKAISSRRSRPRRWRLRHAGVAITEPWE
jgi:hypothetical protein